jgi:hypothetical protein
LCTQGATQWLLAGVKKGMHSKEEGSAGVDITFMTHELTHALRPQDVTDAARASVGTGATHHNIVLPGLMKAAKAVAYMG